MRMRQIRLITVNILVGMVLSLSCSTTEPKAPLESEWDHLGNVIEADCRLWPIREKELDVSSMPSNATETGGFVADVRMRNGSHLPVFANTKGSIELEPEDLTAIPIGRDAQVVAPFNWKNQPLVFVVQNKNERAWLEIRSVADNHLVSGMATSLPEEATSGRVIRVASGWWLQINHGEIDSSYVYVVPAEGSTWAFSASSFQSHSRSALMVANEGQPSAFVIENAGSVNGATSSFLVTKLEPNGQSGSLGKVQVPTKGGLESWSATQIGKKMIIAAVRGDSMVGQGVLAISAFEVGPSNLQLSWSKEFKYDDVHLGDPVWLTNGATGFLTLMKWIDSEGTLSRFKVNDSTAEQLPDLGVFARGSVLVSGYMGPKSHGLGAFRYREKDLWKYKLCKLYL